LDLPEDAERILREQARAEGLDPDAYAKQVFSTFMRYFREQPDLTTRGRKQEWDFQSVFADYVRQNAGDLSLNGKSAPDAERDVPPEERAEAIRSWAANHRHGLPLLSDEDISRDAIYGDRA
jgi:hypothetical protein